ncbi:hypothetical protein V8E36_008757 [Tilletia maclaganii]
MHSRYALADESFLPPTPPPCWHPPTQRSITRTCKAAIAFAPAPRGLAYVRPRLLLSCAPWLASLSSSTRCSSVRPSSRLLGSSLLWTTRSARCSATSAPDHFNAAHQPPIINRTVPSRLVSSSAVSLRLVLASPRLAPPSPSDMTHPNRFPFDHCPCPSQPLPLGPNQSIQNRWLLSRPRPSQLAALFALQPTLLPSACVFAALRVLCEACVVIRVCTAAAAPVTAAA